MSARTAFICASSGKPILANTLRRRHFSAATALQIDSSIFSEFWSLIRSSTTVAPSYLQWLNESFGLPWYMNIGILAVSIRLVTFPMHVRAQRYAAAMVKIQPELILLNTKLKEASTARDTAKGNEIIERIRMLYRKNATSPTRQLACSLFPVPIFVATFVGLREMAATKVPSSLANGGLLWFSNLTAPDPYFVLPLLSSLTILASMELGRLTKDPAFRPIAGGQLTLMRALSFIGFPFVIGMPALLTLYFVSSNLLTCLQAMLLTHRGVRRRLNLPVISQHAALYNYIGDQTPVDKFYADNVKFKPEEPPTPFGFSNNSFFARLKSAYHLAKEQARQRVREPTQMQNSSFSPPPDLPNEATSSKPANERISQST